MADLTYSEISKLLKYDAETGKLFWLPRTPDMFKHSARRNSKDACQSWNTRFALKEAFTANWNGYLSGRIFNTLYRAHRVAWLVHYGKWPNHHIDHINGNIRDNRITNLRDVSRSENMKNTRRSAKNTSGQMGVRFNQEKGYWTARIENSHIGCYSNVADAIAARKQKEIERGYHCNHGRLKETP